MIAYGRGTDPIFYVMCFVDGLRDDIWSAVHMQYPSTLDTACVLALFQEELPDLARRKEVKKLDSFVYIQAGVVSS